MAQYFRPRQVTSSSVASGSRLQNPSDDDHWYRGGFDVEIDNQMASSSILIFPNPPSEREASGSAVESHLGFSRSTSSLPTDVSARSTSSGGRSREEVRPGPEDWREVLCTIPRDRRRDDLVEQESEWEADSGYLRSDHTGFTNHSPSGHASGGLTRTPPSDNNSPFSRSLSLAPQPPFRLPFLSFLRNFMTLDEATLHLISRSPDPHSSALFPVLPGPRPPLGGEEEPVHGALKLLLYSPDKPKNTALLKSGLNPFEVLADANPFLVSATRIPVWRFLEFVIEGGARAWKEVRDWDAGEVMLIGV